VSTGRASCVNPVGVDREMLNQLLMTAGLVMVAAATLPYGVVVLGALWWVWRRS
jgi:hypothetical protein